MLADLGSLGADARMDFEAAPDPAGGVVAVVRRPHRLKGVSDSNS